MTAPGWPEIYPTLNQPDHDKHLDWTFECAEPGCRWMTYHRKQDSAYRERERHHENDLCPYTETILVLSDGGKLVPIGKSIIEKYWEALDEVTKYLIENKDTDPETADYPSAEYYTAKGKAQGIALCIQIISVPHFEDVAAVSRWALKRYKMNANQIEFMDTPGCKGYNPMPPDTVTATPGRRRAPAPAKAPTVVTKQLSDEDREHLLGMVAQKVPVAAILGMLKITPEQYEQEVKRVSA